MEHEKIETVLNMLLGLGTVKVEPRLKSGTIAISVTLSTGVRYYAELDYLNAESVIRNFLRFVLGDLYETWTEWKDIKAYD